MTCSDDLIKLAKMNSLCDKIKEEFKRNCYYEKADCTHYNDRIISLINLQTHHRITIHGNLQYVEVKKDSKRIRWTDVSI